VKRSNLVEAMERHWIAPVRCLIVLLAVIGSPPLVARAATPEPKRVMILHSFGQNFRPWAEYAQTTRAELERQSPWPLDIQDYSLITARSSDEDVEGPFLNYLVAIGGRHPPDLIICVGAPAANFVQRQRERLFPATPIIITAIEQRRVDFARLGENDTAVSVLHDFSASFANILRVLPNTRKIIVVVGASPNERFWLGEIRKEMPPFENRVEFSWTDDIPFEKFLSTASALPPNTVLFWGLMNVDSAGVVYGGDGALKKLHAVANAPIFSYDDGFFGAELVGGPMHSVADGSRRTAAIAVRILGGEKAGDIRPAPTEYVAPKFDWRQLQRWSISEQLLPPGSRIYFREPSAWEKYLWQVAIVGSVVLLQAVLITGLLYERRGRRVAEFEARQRIAQLAHVNRYTLAGELAASIAHELNQPLGSILVNSETATLMLDAPGLDVRELKEILSDIKRDDQRAGEVIRRLRSLLKRAPFEAKEINLNETVGETLDLISALAHARGVSLSSVLAGTPLPVKADNIQLQQVLINLIVNAIDAMAHLESSQRKIAVRTVQNGDFAEIEIADSGPGITAGKLSEVFEPFYTTKPNGMGMGLSIARTIIEVHGGQISAECRAGQGALFRINLPLAHSAVSAAAAS
jgi:signal transduction histidine kinase